MALKWRKKLILAKLEAVAGTDAEPTGAANAIQISDATITPMEGGTVSRGLLRPTLGAEGSIPVNTHVSMEFSVEIAGAGAAGDAPAYGPLLVACAMEETIVAETSVAYSPVSEGEESATIYFYQDGILHAVTMARGTVTLEFPPNDLPRFRFRFLGLHVDPAAAAMPVPDFDAFVPAKPVNKANTPTFTLHGYAAVMERLTVDLGVSNVHRDRVNSAAVLLTDRQTSGTAVIEAPALGTKNYFAIAKAGTLGALQLVHGTVAGNVVQIDAPKVQIGPPAYGNTDGLATLSLPLTLVPDAGDDELVITVK